MLNSLTVLSVFASGEFSGASGCLCTYGNPCWPDAAIFSQLESQVSQPLIYPIPTASACYPASNPSGNCSEVIQNWTDGNWRSSIPGSMDAPNFESFVFKNGTISACYLNTSLGVPCEQGTVPVIGVDARTPADIQAAVNFAIQYNLKLVVKNTGHDFLGRSAARGAFIVWTHNMKNITYDATFAPQGAPSNETYEAVVTLGAGVQWYEAYYAVNQYGRMMVGGITPGGSIGAAGGWLQGGGHSVLSPTYGLGVDNAIEITVVTPTGEYLTVNDYQYSDLFWALRGGGGGTYGVVTSVTYRTYESLPVASYFFQANVTNTTIVNGLATRMLQLQANLTDDGWGGFGYLSNISMSFVAIAPNMSTEAANASIQPWTEYVQSQDISSVAEILPIPSWYEWYSGLFNTSGGNGLNLMITTRLLSRNTTANKFKEIAELLIDCGGQFIMIAGGKVSQINPESAGVNPAWRNAVVEAGCGVTWDEGASSTTIEGMISQLKAWTSSLHDIVPNDGAYFNEASLFEVDWQTTFFGSHYSQLKAIKDKYDPHRLFVVAEGVGSEEWNKELTCRS